MFGRREGKGRQREGGEKQNRYEQNEQEGDFSGKETN